MSHATTAAVLITTALAASNGATGAELREPQHPLRRIRAEKLVYEAKSWKGRPPLALLIPLGTATFTLTRETVAGEPQLVLRAHARGGVPGYPLDATITSRLRDADFLQRLSDSHRVKKGYKRRQLRFHERGADYFKHKHCEAPTLCHNPRHLVTQPDGSKAHCRQFDTCENLDHFVWSLRYRHRSGTRMHDLLGALYLSRAFHVEVGGPVHSMRVVNARDIWDVQIHAEKEETVRVPAGRIRCIRIRLKQVPVNEHAQRDEFEGPFGLHGDIVLYADKETKQAVLVRGRVKLGATFQVEVALRERSVELLPPAPRPAR